MEKFYVYLGSPYEFGELAKLKLRERGDKFFALCEVYTGGVEWSRPTPADPKIHVRIGYRNPLHYHETLEVVKIHSNHSYVSIPKVSQQDIGVVIRWLVDELQSLGVLISQKTPATRAKRINRDTIRKLRELATFRDSALQQRNQVPSWSTACKQIPIDPKTVVGRFPLLRERWEDKSYRLSEIEEFIDSLERG